MCDQEEKFPCSEIGNLPPEEAETKPTPDTVSLPLKENILSSPEEADNKDWGLLLPLQPEFPHFKLKGNKKQYSFGKSASCDYSFQCHSIKVTGNYQHYSKKQFSIYYQDGHVYIKDLGSKNGIFVNCKVVQPNNPLPLKHSDTISISLKQNKAFIFIDINDENAIIKAPKTAEEKVERDYYINTNSLGQGSYGSVYRVWTLEDVKYPCYAMKTAMPLIDNPNNLDVRVEAEILHEVNHPCIVHVFDVISTAHKIHIIMDYAEGGDLYKVTNATRACQPPQRLGLPEDITKLYFYQILSAINYLHGKNICHRDLTLQNVLKMSTDDVSVVKLADFGLSRFLRKKQVNMKELISKFEDDGDPERMTTCNLGAISYNPPELLWLRIKENYENGGLTDDKWAKWKSCVSYS